MSGTNNYTGGMTVNAGVVHAVTTAAIPTGTALSVNGSGKVVLDQAGGGSPLILSSLAIQCDPTSSATFDMNKTTVIVHNGSSDSVRNLLQTGLNITGVSWTGSGIISAAAANDNANRFAASSLPVEGIGYMSGSSWHILYGSSVLFDGLSVADSDLLLKRTFMGDADMDGRLTLSDFAQVDSGFLWHLHNWVNGDFNYDNTVDYQDYNFINNVYNNNYYSQGMTMAVYAGGIRPLLPTNLTAADMADPDAFFRARLAEEAAIFGMSVADLMSQIMPEGSSRNVLAGNMAMAAAPEPASLALLGVGALSLLRRRKR